MKNFLLLLSEKLEIKKIRVLSGFVLILFCLILTNSLSMLYVSIICTAGIGTAFWLAIAYIIGTILSIIVNFLVGSKRRELALDEKQAVEKYVREAKERQLSRNEVRRKLIEAGWNDQLITKIINSIYGQENQV